VSSYTTSSTSTLKHRHSLDAHSCFYAPHPSLPCIAILILLISLCTSSNTVSIYPPLHCDVEVEPYRRKGCHCAFPGFRTARCSQDGWVVPTYLGIDERLCGLVVLESAVVVLYQHPCPQSNSLSISDRDHGRQIVLAREAAKSIKAAQSFLAYSSSPFG
jgi:hypothetical protein